MRIRCLTTFLDDRDRFEAGDVRTVDDEKGARFIANGWAEDAQLPEAVAFTPAPSVVELDTQSPKLGAKDNNG